MQYNSNKILYELMRTDMILIAIGIEEIKSWFKNI